MNRTPDVELVLRDWLADDGDIAPDRILEFVAERIARQPRRPALRLPWRHTVNSTMRVAAGLAAAIVVAVAIWQVLPARDGPGVPTNPVPTPTAAPSASPTGAPASAGSTSFKPLRFTAPSLTIEAAMPADWGVYDSWMLLGPQPADEDTGEVKIAFIAAEALHSDPCRWDHLGDGNPNQPGDLEVGPTVDDLVSALATSDSYEATTPTDVTLGGFPGKTLDIEFSPDFSACDGEFGVDPRRFVFSGAESGGVTVIGEAARSRVSVVDVNGVRLIAVLMSYAGTTPAELAAAQAILDSLVITP